MDVSKSSRNNHWERVRERNWKKKKTIWIWFQFQWGFWAVYILAKPAIPPYLYLLSCCLPWRRRQWSHMSPPAGTCFALALVTPHSELQVWLGAGQHPAGQCGQGKARRRGLESRLSLIDSTIFKVAFLSILIWQMQIATVTTLTSQVAIIS